MLRALLVRVSECYCVVKREYDRLLYEARAQQRAAFGCQDEARRSRTMR